MRRRGSSSALLSGLGLLGMVVAWWMLAPQQLGGQASYAVVRGNSMEPRLSAGDLVVVRRAAGYMPGQVVAYESPTLGATVLHRIIGREGGGFVVQGDNNPAIDPDRPVTSQVIGKLWFAIPGAGSILEKLRRPDVLAGVTGVILLLLFGLRTSPQGAKKRQRRKKGTEMTVVSAGKSAASATSWRARKITVLALAFATATFGALGLAGFGAPLTKSSSSSIPFEHLGKFGYSGPVPKGPVYDGARVGTGETVYLNLVDRLNLRFSYELSSGVDHRLSGTGRMVVTLHDPEGWNKTILEGDDESFEGGHLELHEELAVGDMRSVIRRVQRLTGVIPTAYTLTVEPEIELEGEMAGQALVDSYAPVLTFDLTDLRMKPSATGEENGFDRSAPGSVAVEATVPNQLSFLGRSLSVSTARTVAPLGFGIALIALAAACLRLRRARPRDEAEAIEARFGHRVLQARGSRPAATATIEMDSMDALAQVADLYGCILFRIDGRNGPTYFAEHDSVLYTYRVALAETVAAPAAVGDDELERVAV